MERTGTATNLIQKQTSAKTKAGVCPFKWQFTGAILRTFVLGTGAESGKVCRIREGEDSKPANPVRFVPKQRPWEESVESGRGLSYLPVPRNFTRCSAASVRAVVVDSAVESVGNSVRTNRTW